MVSVQARLERHVGALRECRRCPLMIPPPVSGGAVVSPVMLVGQAPGVKEPILGRPFAWTAGRTLFGWFERACGWSEGDFRARIYMAAVCRCFPGKLPQGGDRVPNPAEIERCADWLAAEIALLQPRLIIPVGRLAIAQFLPMGKLVEMIGQQFSATRNGVTFDLVPLPHPSGASPWHRMEPGRTLLAQALGIIAAHEAMRLPPTLA